ncbi:hypothetical protein MES4922_300307 [Mesorhizobium ventifaucium]|uniref:Uncharacterized protein n=1 Tax=Mesorhizobium ventifaucium TaxID=666020 RepID=A0ABM9E3C5_9HYPH|nr:hypothetical protein MES4922_300307 [Mesorhizobium ventifaucium]
MYRYSGDAGLRTAVSCASGTQAPKRTLRSGSRSPPFSARPDLNLDTPNGLILSVPSCHFPHAATVEAWKSACQPLLNPAELSARISRHTLIEVVDTRTELEQNTNILKTGERYDWSCSGCRVTGVHEHVSHFHGDLDRSDVRQRAPSFTG